MQSPIKCEQALYTLSAAIDRLRSDGVTIQTVTDGHESIRADDVRREGWDDGSRYALRYAPNSTQQPIRIGDWCLVEWDRKTDNPVRLSSGQEFVVYRLF